MISLKTCFYMLKIVSEDLCLSASNVFNVWRRKSRKKSDYYTMSDKNLSDCTMEVWMMVNIQIKLKVRTGGEYDCFYGHFY